MAMMISLQINSNCVWYKVILVCNFKVLADRPLDASVPINDLDGAEDKEAVLEKDDALQAGIPQESEVS